MGIKVEKALLWFVTMLLAYSILLPILILIIAVNELTRATLTIWLYCSRSNLELISDGIENIYPTNVEAKGGLILSILASPHSDPNLEQERMHFQKVVLQKPGPNGINGLRMYERLEKYLDSKWGYGCRRNGEFNIENHVRLWTETSPANGKFYTELEFQGEIIQNLSNHFDYSSKPGWEWVIIPKVQLDQNDPHLSTVRVFRVHHSYMDGLSAGLLVTECLMDFHPSSDRPHFFLDPKAKLPRSVSNLVLLNQIKAFVVLPYYLMRGLLLNRVPPSDPVRTGPNAGIKHYGVSKKIELNLIRDIRSKLASQKIQSRGTTNVLASILVSALTQVLDLVNHLKFLDENGRLTDHSKLVLNAPTAIFPYEDSRPRNQVLPPPFQLSLRKSTEMQLVDVTGSGKYSYPLRLFLLGLGRFQPRIFNWVLPKVSAKFRTSTIFTCVPGLKSKGHLSCGGDLVTDMGAWSVVSKYIGLTVVVMSYGDHIRYWCVVDDAVMSRGEFDHFLELLTLQK